LAGKLLQLREAALHFPNDVLAFNPVSFRFFRIPHHNEAPLRRTPFVEDDFLGLQAAL
jgi:hypothetical protein